VPAGKASLNPAGTLRQPHRSSSWATARKKPGEAAAGLPSMSRAVASAAMPRMDTVMGRSSTILRMAPKILWRSRWIFGATLPAAAQGRATARKTAQRRIERRRARAATANGLVRAVGLEPTRLATADFESAASTISPRPHIRLRRVLPALPEKEKGGSIEPPFNAEVLQP